MIGGLCSVYALSHSGDTVNRRHLLQYLAAVNAVGSPLSIAQSVRPIVLGQSAAFTGPAAQLGVQMNRGARLYFDAVNAAGGINGRTIELRTLDDGYEPERCKANTERFIKEDVLALFGYVGTPTSLAALPLVNSARMPFFAPFTGAEALRDPFSKQVFHIRASYYDETALIVKTLTSLDIKKIAVVYQNDAYGKAGLEGVLRALKPLGLAPVATGNFERNTVNVAQAVKDIVPSRPEAIVQIGAYKSCAAFIREARQAGYRSRFFNVSFVGTQALADELGKEGSGIMISQVMPYPFTTTLPITREYLAAVRSAGGDATPNYSSIEGYIAAKVFTQGLKRAGSSLTRESLVSALETLHDYDAGGFYVSFGPRNHAASRFVELSVLDESGKVRR
jgi:branched-chain amino acid transport system substrate-binding protein